MLDAAPYPGIMSTIRINYAALNAEERGQGYIGHELVKKARGFFGGGARKQIRSILDSQIRLLAVEVAQRQTDPHALYQAGFEGLDEAIKIYDPERTELTFRSFALPIIRQHMQRSRIRTAA
jgi:DNA-directed RNA polymerase sigma subunit (sigma70/sigma32)